MIDYGQVLQTYFYNEFPAILSILAGCFLITSQMPRRKHWQLRLLLSFLLISGWMTLFSRTLRLPLIAAMPFPQSGILKYIGLFTLSVAATAFFSTAGFYTSLFTTTISYCLQHLCDRIMEIPRYNFEIPTLLDRLLLLSLMALSLYLYGRIGVWNRQDQRFNRFDRLDSRILLLIASVVVTMNIVLDLIAIRASQGNRQMLDCFHAISAVVSFLVILVSMCHLRESDSRIKAEFAFRMLRLERERFALEKDIHDAINIKCHDIRHQIAALGEAGRQASLSEINDLVNIYDTTVHSDSAALDVVLSNKNLACLNRHITLLCMADGRRLGFMEDTDIYALFGNILDNAIEAVAKLEDPELRLISLTVTVKGAFLVIEEENYYQGELTFHEGVPETSKEDKLYHGYGMQSIRMLTEKYEGDLQIQTDGGLFRLSIMIPVQQGAETEQKG